MELNRLCNSCDKRLLCMLLSYFRFLFRYLFSPFIPPPALSLSALASFGDFPYLSTLVLGPAISWFLLPGIVLGLCSGFFIGIILLLLLFDYFLANLFSFSARITVPSSLQYLRSLAVAVSAVDEKQTLDTHT